MECLLGAAAIIGPYQEIYTNAPSQFIRESPEAGTTVLLAAAFGYLATSVVYDLLTAAGDDEDHTSGGVHSQPPRGTAASQPKCQPRLRRAARRPDDRGEEVVKRMKKRGVGGVLDPSRSRRSRPAASPAGASVPADVTVSNTETVQAYLDAAGSSTSPASMTRSPCRARHGRPGESGLHRGTANLDQFGGFEVENGEIVGTYEVDGELRLRSVSDFTKTLPLEVKVTYILDGKEVAPEDVVGKTGSLEVRYVVRNVTGQPQEITYDDGTGQMVTSTEDVVIPMVGSLSTVLPPSFTDVASNQANMAGDGRGGTKMSFTMTLFGPIGTPEASFGYTASIADAVIPPATISALPVSPLESPSFKGGAASYQSGAAAGVTLTAGATQIDDNLLKLRDGAGELLAGLIKLSNGANQLNAGLTGTAAPGAAQLAAGADKAADGASQLSSGVTQLDDGANKLSSGANQVADGADSAAEGADSPG